MTADQELAALKTDHGRWQIWYVPVGVGKPAFTWHTREWDNADLTQTLHADSPDHLREYIAEWEKGERPEEP